MSEREISVSGTFYPDSKEEVLKYIDYFNNNFSLKNEINLTPRAIIVPHAGYVYSGFTANLAYNIASKHKYKRIVVIGPSHKVYIDGASIALYDEYPTPLGNIEIDKEYSLKLKEKYEFLNFFNNAHKEHSTETQAPFVKNYFEDTKMIEIVYGKINFEVLSIVIEELLEDKDNLVVISTDLSHFHTKEEANILDAVCIEAIVKKDMQMFEKGCEACGIVGVKAITNLAVKNNFKTKMLYYCTSYDVTKDDKSVVGYTSILIGE